MKAGIISSAALVCCCVLIGAQPSLAQIAPDDTLGPESSRVTPENLQRDRIDGGARRGANLFHSFREFNIGEGRAAYFDNPAGVANILSRVTGSNASEILGTLGVMGESNLFFLNPNGIIFGPNARLDVRGSFVATTANGFTFPDGSEFGAIDPQAPPLLTVSVPVGLQYGTNQSGDITNRGTLVADQDLTLTANNLDLQGQLQAGRNLTLQAQNTLRIRDTAINSFIAASGGPMVAQGNQAVDIFALNHPSSGLYSGGDMLLRSLNPINGDAHYWSGGSFQIEQLDGNLGNLFSEFDPIIRSQGDVNFFGYQGASLHILAGGSVNIGTVIITGPDTTGDTINPITTPELANVTLSDETSLVIDGSARPTLDIRAGVDPSVIGNPLGTIGDDPTVDQFFDSLPSLVPPPDNNPVATSADITIGDVVIVPLNGLVFLTNQYEPNETLNGDISVSGDGIIQSPNGNDFNGIVTNGNSGDVIVDPRNIIIDSRDNINLLESVFIATDPDFRSIGSNSGDIVLLANRNITLSQDVSLASEGSVGGNITLISGENIFATSSKIQISSSSEIIETSGGNIEVTAGNSVIFDEGAGIFAVTFGSPSAGNVIVQAGEVVTFSGTINNFPGGVRSQIGLMASGDGGNVVINTQQLRLSDGARISIDSFGSGNAGNIIISASDVKAIGESSSNGDASGIFADVTRFSSGNGGNITISTERLQVKDGAQISASTRGSGNGGDLIIEAEEVETVGTASGLRFPSGLFANVNSSSQGDGGDLLIETERLLIADGAQVSASTFGSGNAGNLTVRARLIEIRGVLYRAEFIDTSTVALDLAASTLSVQSNPSATEDGGDLLIETERLLIADGGQVLASAQGSGNAGNLTIRARSVEVAGFSNVEIAGTPVARLLSILSTEVEPSANGNGGDLVIDTQKLSVADEAKISAEAQGVGLAGDMRITTEELTIETGARISATSTATATTAEQGGSIIVNASRLDLSGAGGIFTQTEGGTPGGSVILGPYPGQSALTINLQDSAQISASTSSSGQGGSLRIAIPEAVRIRGDGRLSVETTGTGIAGDINITAPNLLIEDGTVISAQSTGAGNAGSLNINDVDQLTVRNGAQLTVSSTGLSQAGNLNIDARNVSLRRNAGLTAQTESGRGGSINLQIAESLRLDNDSQISASTQDGQGGRLSINADRSPINLINLSGGSRIATEATSGNAGTLSINARQLSLQDSAISASTSSGLGGGIVLRGLDSLEVNNSEISASTQTGQAGSLRIEANERIELTGTGGLLVEAAEGGTAGDLNIRTEALIVADNAQVTVSSPEGQAGNLTVNTDTLFLDNGQLIADTAESDRGEGANIRLQVSDLLFLENNSQISANAGEAANGGNVIIDNRDGFIVAIPSENSDITANADRGDGGRVEIEATQGLFGIEFREQRTPLSDITASSESGNPGVVTINRPDVDPSRGLVELPETVVDPSEQIAQGCVPSEGAVSQFVSTGRGGLPLSPDEPLRDRTTLTPEWVTLDSEEENAVSAPLSTRPTSDRSEASAISPDSPPAEIVEADGWLVDAQGNIVLVAQAQSTDPVRSHLAPVPCPN
jgi:filamentous hemagglutinin family protein